MLDTPAISAAYQDVLLRDPEPSAVTALRAAPAMADEPWLVRELLGSVEYCTIVEPIRRLLVQEWEHWAFRPPTKSELRQGVDATRGRCGSDDAVRRAFADGSIRTKLAFRPIKLEIDITNQCNLRCVMCHFSLPSYYERRRQHMSVAQFERIGEQVFHRAHQVSLSYGTEPLLHRELPALLACLRRHEVPHSYLHTNGLLLRESAIEAMIEHSFSLVFVSIDAATAGTYERIRVGGSFERLLQNLALLQSLKQRHGSQLPRLGLGFVLMRQNVAELPAFVELAARVGAGSVNAMHMAAWADVGNAAMAANHVKEQCNESLAVARAPAARLGITFVAPPPFRGGRAGTLVADTRLRGRDYGLAEFGPHATCPFPWTFAAIDPYGEVMPCGWWDCNEIGSMGNVFASDFAAIWRGLRFQALRARLRARQLEGPCSHCPAAGMGAPDAATAFRPN